MERTTKLTELSYGEVQISDSYMKNAYEKECIYLKSLDVDRLLKGFKEVAGISEQAIRYPGWEETEIQGHTLGHYLTAISQAYAYGKDLEFLARVNYCIDELALCQDKSGYLFAFAEEIFDRVEQKRPAWVPWYTMHKIFEGLLSAYRLTDSQKALSIAKKLGFWVYHRCKNWSEATIKTVLSVEYGGMNDCLYELYEYTGEEIFLHVADVFDEKPLFQELEDKKDILNGLHANTTIPKILGAANRYRLIGGAKYKKTAEAFWDIVKEHHTYVTGGNSEWEHFGRPDTLDAERTACNCETCNTYNMLKLSKRLFLMTKNVKYMNFYDHTLTNAILSSQNPETGMTMYFQPMATGYFKTYATPYDKFWCCTGTGMENFTKLCEGIYFYGDGELFVTRMVSSIVKSEALGFEMVVTADLMKTDTITFDIIENVGRIRSLRIQIPDWAKQGMDIQRNEASMQILKQKESFLITDLKQAEHIQIKIPMQVSYECLPDNEEAVAFSYGPFVLCAKMGSDMMNTTTTGVDVTVAMKEFFVKDYLVINKTAKEWLMDLQKNFVKDADDMVFHLKEADLDLSFVPYFSLYKERYGIYFRLYQKGGKDLEKRHQMEEKTQLVEKEAFDMIPIGNDQYELAHHVNGAQTDFCIHNGHRCRFIERDGFISYQLKVDDVTNRLCITYQKDHPLEIPILWIGDTKVDNYIILRESKDGFYTVGYEIPTEQINGNNTIIVKFQNRSSESDCGRMYDYVYTCKTK